MIRNTECFSAPLRAVLVLTFLYLMVCFEGERYAWPQIFVNNHQSNPKLWLKWFTVWGGVDGPGGCTFPMHLIKSSLQTVLEIWIQLGSPLGLKR